MPALVQVSVGFAIVGSLRMPELVVHEIVKGCGWPSLSVITLWSAITFPIGGLLEIESMFGQALRVPFTSTLPLWLGALQESSTLTLTVDLAVTVKGPASPVHTTSELVTAVALRLRW